MTHCCQIKFSLDYEPLTTKTSEHFIPIKTRHSSFIMRLKSNTKNKITKYQLGPRKHSLLDDLSNCLSTPIPRYINEKSKQHHPDLLKLNVTNVTSLPKKQQTNKYYGSPMRTTNGFDRRRKLLQKTEERMLINAKNQEAMNVTQIVLVEQSCPLYTPKSEYTPRKSIISSHARLRIIKPKQYEQFYGDQKSEDNIKIMITYYRDFIWKVAFSNQHQLKVIEKPRVYIGKGNNSRLMKSIMRSRWWWTFQKDQNNANFLWTQLKLSSIYPNQKTSKSIPNELKPIEQIVQSLVKGDPAVEIMNQNQLNQWNTYFKNAEKNQKKVNETMDCRRVLHRNLKVLNVEKTSNHLEFSRMIGNKKALFYTMKQYYQLSNQDYREYLPLTYHIVSGTEDDEYTSFLKAYSENRKGGKMNMWIVKPGELSNRGNGIKVCSDLNQIRQILKSKAVHYNGRQKTYIVQQYLSEPFLYKARKFDIRHYMMITSVDGIIKGYWYEEGYLRTTSFQYNVNQLGGFIHLTNDAVQKYHKDYGKYEKGNKLSYSEFQNYLNQKHGQGTYVFSKVLQKMKKVATDIMRAAYLIIDPNKREHNFEIFGLDFMIDSQFNPWLIECNTNPCIELSSPVLAKIIPAMLDNALRIGLDPLFPPPPGTYPIRKVPIDTNKFELVFDELRDGKQIYQLYKGQKSVTQFLQDIGSDDQAFEDNDQSQDD